MRILPPSMAPQVDLPPKTFGFAISMEEGQFGRIAYVFYDRVDELSREHGHSRARTLGYVVAHEIGHLLLGRGSHAQTGIMRCPWSSEELKAAAAGTLLFTPKQARRIRDQVAERLRVEPIRHQAAARMQARLTSTEPQAPTITIRVYNYAEVPMQALQTAQKEAAFLLGRVGITTHWLNCLPASGVEKDPACQKPKGPTDLVLRTLTRPMAGKLEIPSSDLRFGYALQSAEGGFGSIAGVFSFRVEELAEEAARRMDISPTLRPVILGHLMAHEIGHLLLGSGSHSPQGVMRGRWGKEDLHAADRGSLGFTTRQGEQMREQINARLRSSGAAGSWR